MRLRKAKQICFAIHYGHGPVLNWTPETLRRMEKHRRKWNRASRRRIAKQKAARLSGQQGDPHGNQR